jgi:hypothetical protein
LFIFAKVLLFLSAIVESIRSRYVGKEEDSDIETSDADVVSLSNKMSHWYEKLEDAGNNSVPYEIPEDSQQKESINAVLYDGDQENVDDAESPRFDDQHSEVEHEDINTTELLAYRELMNKAPAYEWLLSCLHQATLLTPSEPNCMDAIRAGIVSSPRSHKISRRQPSTTYKVIFRIDWDPRAFIKEQGYIEEPTEVIERVITLTGSHKDAQALVCMKYLEQGWPFAAKHLIELVKDVVRSEAGYRAHK